MKTLVLAMMTNQLTWPEVAAGWFKVFLLMVAAARTAPEGVEAPLVAADSVVAPPPEPENGAAWKVPRAIEPLIVGTNLKAAKLAGVLPELPAAATIGSPAEVLTPKLPFQ